jgi:acylaminoacyl-peptidase
MFDITDIPDWCYHEGLGKWTDFKEMPSSEDRVKMFECSPVAHLGKIKTPYLLLIGEEDLRVAPHYKSFIRNLKARDIPTK